MGDAARPPSATAAPPVPWPPCPTRLPLRLAPSSTGAPAASVAGSHVIGLLSRPRRCACCGGFTSHTLPRSPPRDLGIIVAGRACPWAHKGPLSWLLAATLARNTRRLDATGGYRQAGGQSGATKGVPMDKARGLPTFHGAVWRPLGAVTARGRAGERQWHGTGRRCGTVGVHLCWCCADRRQPLPTGGELLEFGHILTLSFRCI